MEFNQGTSASTSRAFTSRDDHPDSDTQVRNSHHDRSHFDLSGSKEFKLQELAMLSITPLFRSIQRWWLHRAERHYLICADVELQRAREAQMNVAYYQKRAALARSARI
jgi:hypothetical protein